MTSFKKYLADLGITLPEETPPIGSTKKAEEMAISNIGSLSFMGVLLIGENHLDDSVIVVKAYSKWALTNLVLSQPKRDDKGMNDLNTALKTADVLSAYYTSSFFDEKPHGWGWPFALMEVRGKFGKDFTDRMVAYSFRTILNNLSESDNQDFDAYFLRYLAVGDFVMDPGRAKWPEISEILNRNGHLMRKAQ